ncbi:hypothetical protein DFO45_2272 [Azorhizobium sp. AG788]|nr:hypothetical protein DFO45_2272 [Azorhizobium sp. AG788]
MPKSTMKSQNGNSCGAHCAALAISELTGNAIFTDEAIVEGILWNSIIFRASHDPMTILMANNKYTDPRRVVTYINNKSLPIKAELILDTVSQAAANNFLNQTDQQKVDACLNVLAGEYKTATLNIDEGKYYSCTYYHFHSRIPSKNTFALFHNILVTKHKGAEYYYNSNENSPAWIPVAAGGWKRLDGQNNRTNSYVFSGLAVVVAPS